MNVLFLNAPADSVCVREGHCQGKPRFPSHPPIFLAQTASILEREGCRCGIIDCPAEGVSDGQALESSRTFAAGLAIVNATTVTLRTDTLFIAKVRRALPSLSIVAAGPHGTFCPQDLLQAGCNFVVHGEPENPLKNLVSTLRAGATPRGIKGLTYLKEGIAVGDSSIDPVQDLDGLPFPARHLLRQELYRNALLGGVYTTLRASRGCHHHCTYCIAKDIFSRNVRYRSVESLLSEITSVAQEFKIRNFVFFDDAFTANSKLVTEFCKAVIDSGLKIRWACNSRADEIDYGLALEMKKAGCVAVSLGIESGSQIILNSIKKGTTVQAGERAIAWAKRAGLAVEAYIVIGFPDESLDTIEETRRFLLRAEPDDASVCVVKPFPGTEVYQEFKRRGLLLFNDWEAFEEFEDHDTPLIRSAHLEGHDILQHRDGLNRSFVNRPSCYVRRAMRVRQLGFGIFWRGVKLFLRNSFTQQVPS